MVNSSALTTALTTVQSTILTKILDGIRVVAGILAVVCLLLLFVLDAPRPLLTGLLVIVVSELVIVEGSRVLIRQNHLHRAALVHIASTQPLVLSVALLLNSSSFLSVTTALLMIMAIVLVGRWFALWVGLLGMVGYLALPTVVAYPAVAQIIVAVPDGLHVLLEASFTSAALVVIAVMIFFTTQILRATVAQATRLVEEQEALREVEADTNQQLNQQVQEQRRLLEVIQSLEAPIVPLRDGILVVPLVSYLNSERLAAIEARVLAAVHQRRAQLILVDLTGVPIIDTIGVQGILRLVEATRLLGTQVALTGLRPAIAQTMVELGMRLHALVSYATIQDALAEAHRIRPT